VALILTPAAQAKTINDFHQVVSEVPARAAVHIGNLPIDIVKPRLKTVTLRSGGNRYRGFWNNVMFIVGGKTTSFLLGNQRREIRSHGGERTVIFADQLLSTRDKRDFKVLDDIGRDADVLVVARNHPACAGITSSQARQIASGAITRWSQVVSVPAGQPDAITLRHSRYGSSFEVRFGVAKLPQGARADSDGGLSELGDRGVAAITSWSRFRQSGEVDCAVPLDGIAPTNATVHALAYPGAYPISLVAHRKRQASAHNRVVRAAFVRYFRSAATRKKLKQNGMLLASEPPPTDGPPRGSQPPSDGPGQDHAGRPITPIRDDAAVRSALTAERLEHGSGGGSERFAFDADRVLSRLRTAADGSNCESVRGSWDVEAGWRYDENGGGVIARVVLQLETTTTVLVELSNDEPGTGYVDGAPYSRSRALSAACA
jgi:hypothetical protein